jgi:non-heme chloroperoxidase
MRSAVLGSVALLAAASGFLYSQGSTKPLDRSPHKILFVPVEKNINLEVLDWGGTGRPLVFLAGSGFTAHEFDDFAPKFTRNHHVYGITRRGYGASSAPPPTENNYSADRLGEDVIGVIDYLRLDHPVLVGHSLAGQELSYVASHNPEKAAGLIYLDAAYSYAYYSPALGDPIIDSVDLHQQLTQFMTFGLRSSEELETMRETAARLAADFEVLEKQRALMPPQPPVAANAPPPPPIPMAIAKGREKFTAIHDPVLAFFADPHDFGNLYKDNPKALAAVIANDRETTTAQADAFRNGVPSAQVILIPHASHFIFKSNEAEVVKDMNAFLARVQ